MTERPTNVMRESVAGTVSAFNWKLKGENWKAMRARSEKNDFFIYVFFKDNWRQLYTSIIVNFFFLKQKYATLKKYSKIKDIYFVLLIRMQCTALVSKQNRELYTSWHWIILRQFVTIKIDNYWQFKDIFCFGWMNALKAHWQPKPK